MDTAAEQVSLRSVSCSIRIFTNLQPPLLPLTKIQTCFTLCPRCTIAQRRLNRRSGNPPCIRFPTKTRAITSKNGLNQKKHKQAVRQIAFWLRQLAMCKKAEHRYHLEVT